MFYALNWLVVASLLALWSLATWALHAVAVWSVSNAGAFSGAASGVGGIVLPEWLAHRVPAKALQVMTPIAEGLGQLVEGLLQLGPTLAVGVTVTAWLFWGIGSALLLLLGAALHRLIAMGRRRGSGGSGSGTGPSLATG